jgi:hypothetical protein
VKYSPEELEGDIMYIPRFYRYKKEHQKVVKPVVKNATNTSRESELKFQSLTSHSRPMMAHRDDPLDEGSDMLNQSDIRDEAPVSHKVKALLTKGIDKVKNPHPDLTETQYEEFHRNAKSQFQSKYDSRRISHFIPTLFMPYLMGSSKMLIYFHANAEDIVLAKDLLDYMRVLLRVNVLAVEYPGYGLYTEEHQKRYNYPSGHPQSPKRSRFAKPDSANGKKINYAKEAKKIRDQKLNTDVTEGGSFYNASFSCQPTAT